MLACLHRGMHKKETIKQVKDQGSKPCITMN